MSRHESTPGDHARRETPSLMPVAAVSWETQTWSPTGGISGLTRLERKAQFGSTYASAIPARIADLDLTVPAELSAAMDEATSGLARFDGAARFRSGAFLAVMLRSESASSSQIERITASARSVAEAEITGTGSGNAAIVAANVHAMTQALSFMGPLTAGSIEAIQKTLMAHHESLAGWRTEQVWIGGLGSTPVGADFVPPHQDRVPECMDDLISFIDRDDIPPLLQAAIAHAQFETIHPFADGNGRTGRALIHAVLKEKELMTGTIAPISAGLLVDRETYFAALDSFRRGDAAPIVSAFVRAALHATHHGVVLGDRIDAICDSWRARIVARSDSAVWRVLDAFAGHPVADARTVAAAVGVAPTNVARHLRKLADAGFLVGTQHHRSHRFLYRAPEILAALDEYAAGLGRRAR